LLPSQERVGRKRSRSYLKKFLFESRRTN